MANVGPVGSVIYTNQMTQAATDLQNTQNNRVDFQNIAAQAAANEKQKEIEDVRPAEENQEVDPDREHQRDEADEEAKMLKKRKNKDEDENEEESSNMENALHKLDIKV